MRKILLAAVFMSSLTHTGVLLAADASLVEFLNSGRMLTANLPFSEAVRVGNTLYLSGQDWNRPGKHEARSWRYQGGSEADAGKHQDVPGNARLLVEQRREVTVMLADIAEWRTFNEVYKSFFSKHYPARSAFGASGLALGARVEVECIAAVDK